MQYDPSTSGVGVGQQVEKELPDFSIGLDNLSWSEKKAGEIDENRRRMDKRYRDNKFFKSELKILEVKDEQNSNKKDPLVQLGIVNTTGGLLTPPKEESDSKYRYSVSPLFHSRRPPWIESSSSICSSTPVADKSKGAFGNSSVNITPISDDFRKSRLSTVVNSKYSTIPSVSGLKDNTVADDKMDINFALGMDDDELFANINMDEIVKKAEEKYSSNKSPTVADINKTRFGPHIQSPSLLTVTQVIDMINEPQRPAISDTYTKYFNSEENKSVIKSINEGSCNSAAKAASATQSFSSNTLLEPNKKFSFINSQSNLNKDSHKEKCSQSYYKNNSLKNSFLGRKDSCDDIIGNLVFLKPSSKIVKNLSSEFVKENINDSLNFAIQSNNVIDTSQRNKDINRVVREEKLMDDKTKEKQYLITSFNTSAKKCEKELPHDKSIVQFDMGLDGFEDLTCSKTSQHNLVNLHNCGSLNESDDLFLDVDDEKCTSPTFSSTFSQRNSLFVPLKNLSRASPKDSSKIPLQEIIKSRENCLTANRNDSARVPGKNSPVLLSKESSVPLRKSQKNSLSSPQFSQNLNIPEKNNTSTIISPRNSSFQTKFRGKESEDEESPVILRKRKKMNAVDSEYDETLLNLTSASKDEESPVILRKKKMNALDSEYDETLLNLTSACEDKKSPVILRKKRINHLDSECDETLLNMASVSKRESKPKEKVIPDFDRSSDDDFNVSVDRPLHQPKMKLEEKKKKNKNKRRVPGLIDVEAEVDDSIIHLSSDESESSSDNYDSSFVDDEIEQTQQNVDMQAIYLQSVRSPPKKERQVKRNLGARQIMNETVDEDDFEDEEEEDSFVVENDVVEYDTQYMGDTMLAVDPIIHQVLEKGSKKICKPTSKRRRIVEINSSSEEEDSPKKSGSSVQENTNSKSMKMQNLEKKTDSENVEIIDNGRKVCFTEGSKTFGRESSYSQRVTGNSIDIGEDLRSSVDGLLNTEGRMSLNRNNNAGKTAIQEVSVKEHIKGTAAEEDDAIFALLPDDDFLWPSNKNILCRTSLKTPEILKKSPGHYSPKIGTARKFGCRSISCNEIGTGETTDFKSKLSFASQRDYKLRNTSVPACATNNSLNTFHTLSTTTPVTAICHPTSNKTVTNASIPKAIFSNTSISDSTTASLIKSSEFSINKSVNSSHSSVSETSRFDQNTEKQCILVDTSEVSMAGMISSTLRLKHGVQTYILQITPASYIVSRRMAVFRQSYSVFSNSVNRSRLITRFQLLLESYERVFVIVERESKAGPNVVPRTFYLDTISCACAQLPQLKVLYSCNQDESADLIWSLANREKLKGNAIPRLPLNSDHLNQLIKFYRTAPKVSATSAICLALNFRSIKDAVNSNMEDLKKKGGLSSEAATAFKAHFSRTFRKDLLNASLKQES